MMTASLLEVESLTVELGRPGSALRPVEDVSLAVAPSEVVGLVGESGCGKSMTALSIMRLVPPQARLLGRVLFAGRDLLPLDERDMRRLRGAEIAMVFQEPMTSLDPVFTIGRQLVEAIRAHRSMGRAEARDRAAHMLDRVGLAGARARMSAYPHELSGGMRQRVMIAMALLLGPRLLIADEPTTALDVTVQAQVLDLIAELQDELRMSVLLITHDLAVVGEMASRIAIMYAGEIVEVVTSDQLFDAPLHPYTQALLRSRPAAGERGAPLHVIGGRVPDLGDMPRGCRFAPRCRSAIDRCWAERPPLVASEGGRLLRCFNPGSFDDH
jgi:oligopeptide/dipeptide ABC transporter ATP-binding protein